MSDPSENEKASSSEEEVFEEEEAAGENEGDEENSKAEEKLQESTNLQILQEKGNSTSATIIFTDEDHTLGNLLRDKLSQNSNVDFVGYSIPHPSEAKLNLRLQTKGNDVKVVLKEGLLEISKDCRILMAKLREAQETKQNPNQNQNQNQKTSKTKKK